MSLQIRRGLEVDRSGITPDPGEILMTTDTKQFFIGDGTFPGGHKVGGVGSALLAAEQDVQFASPTLGWTAQGVVKQLASVRSWAGSADDYGFKIPAMKSIVDKHDLMVGYLPRSALQDGGYIDIHVSGTYSPRSTNPALFFKVNLKNTDTGNVISLTPGGPTGAVVGWGFSNATAGITLKKYEAFTRFTFDLRIRSLGRHAFQTGDDTLKLKGLIEFGEPIRYDGLNIGGYARNSGAYWNDIVLGAQGPVNNIYQSGYVAEHHGTQYRCIQKHGVTGVAHRFEPGRGYEWKQYWRRSHERHVINDTYSVDLRPAYEITVQIGGPLDQRITLGHEFYDRCLVEGGDILLVGSFGGLEWTP